MSYRSNYLQKKISRRHKFAIIILLALTGTVAIKAIYAMIVSDKDKDLVSNQITWQIENKRGNIYDRNNNLIALSTPVYDLVVNPKKVVQESEISAVRDMARWFGLSPDKIISEIKDLSNKEYYLVKRNVTEEQKIKFLEQRELLSIRFDKRYKRYYPMGEILSHLVGITNVDNQGIEGLELHYNQLLSGVEGKYVVTNIHDSEPNIEIKQNASFGSDLILSIDSDIQFVAYKELKKAMVNHDATSGGVVVLDAKTGEILALSSQPGFNPNNQSEFKPRFIRNRVYTDLIEPGSTIKPLIMAMAMELGRVDEKSTFELDSFLKIGGNIVNDPFAYGKLNAEDIIVKSSNVGMVTVAQTMSAKEIWNYLNLLGFAEASRLGFPGETNGRIRILPKWNEAYLSSLAYGYGLNVSLIQLARSYLVLANRGHYLSESIVKLEDEEKLLEGKKIFSTKTVRSVMDMMVKVTQNGGTGTRAALKNYHVAGKTGTTYKRKGNYYNQNNYVAMFVGIVPATDPDMVMVVWIDDPKRGKNNSGGKVAAPVFKQVMQQALRLRNVPPDKNLPSTNALVLN